MKRCDYCFSPIEERQGYVTECGTGWTYHVQCARIVMDCLDAREKRQVFGIFHWRRRLDNLFTWLLSKLPKGRKARRR